MRLEAQFLRFCMIGGLNTAIQYVVFLVLFRVFGFYMVASSAVGYLAGILNSYLLNRRFTFQVANRWSPAEFLRFFLINLVAMGVNLGLLKVLVARFSVLPEIAQVVAIGGSLVVNFAGNKWWTFQSTATPAEVTEEST